MERFLTKCPKCGNVEEYDIEVRKSDLRELVERLKELDLLLPDMTETVRADGYRFSYTEIEKLLGGDAIEQDK